MMSADALANEGWTRAIIGEQVHICSYSIVKARLQKFSLLMILTILSIAHFFLLLSVSLCCMASSVSQCTRGFEAPAYNVSV